MFKLRESVFLRVVSLALVLCMSVGIFLSLSVDTSAAVVDIDTDASLTDSSDINTGLTDDNESSVSQSQSETTLETVFDSTEVPTDVATEAPTSTPSEEAIEDNLEVATEPSEIIVSNKKEVAKTSASTKKLEITRKTLELYVTNYHVLKATKTSGNKWSTSNSSVATVTQAGLVIARGVGKAKITVKNKKESASCTVTVKKATASVDLSHHKTEITAGKTFFATSDTNGVKWTSTNESVATVNNGFVHALKPGRTVIRVYKTGGMKTLYVKVLDPEPVRFAYPTPNCATKNSEVVLTAITDQTRTGVKFEVDLGEEEPTTVEATYKKKDGDTYFWRGYITMDKAGTYDVKTYSQIDDEWLTCDNGDTSIFVSPATLSTSSIYSPRRASTEIIKMISTFEGYMPSVYEDVLTGDPTLGYGKLVYAGDQFYNSLTKREAHAYLIQTVNTEGYSSKVNEFLNKNKVKYNQQQLDALVCFVYNLGVGVLSADDELRDTLLDCSAGDAKKEYYISGSNVRIRKGAGTKYDIIKELNRNTKLTILSTSNSSWYKVKLEDGTTGYVSSDYIASKVISGTLNLKYVDKDNLISDFCQYHHAGGCIKGLLYRRVDELEVFFYEDYKVDYGKNKYGFKFRCKNNKSFSIGY